MWILVATVVCAAPVICGNKMGRTEERYSNHLVARFTVKQKKTV